VANPTGRKGRPGRAVPACWNWSFTGLSPFSRGVDRACEEAQGVGRKPGITGRAPSTVMAGLVPAIPRRLHGNRPHAEPLRHTLPVSICRRRVDGRDKPGHDGVRFSGRYGLHASRNSGLVAAQAFPNPCQTFPNLRPFSPSISKDSFVHFVGNQRLAGGKRKFRLPANSCAALPSKPCAAPRRQGGLATNTYRRIARLPFFRKAILGSADSRGMRRQTDPPAAIR